MASIKDILDMPVAKRSKASTSINTLGLCKSKENVLKCIANWLSLMNHNFNINDTAPPLLYGAFFKLANLITVKEYKTWHGCSFHKAPWILPQHIDQLQRIMSRRSKSANTPALICQVLAGRPLDPALFVCIPNATTDLIQGIEICIQLSSLGEIFAEPSVLYVKPVPVPAPAPTNTPTKHPRKSPGDNNDSEMVKKRKKAEKEGWLKKSSR
eukprot:13589521-Ditylum_brightwellii.AAC.1